MHVTDKPATPGEPANESRAVAAFAVELDDIVRRFGTVEALSHIRLGIRKGEFFSLLGPSGCGKTTLLRVVAGLDLQDEGTVRLGGENVRNVPAHKRPVNTVFQSYALFPHLGVFDNIAFGLRMKKVSPPEIDARVQRVMATVEIESLAERRPSQLSGGQKQRVALARAIVNEPQVLLLDEPLGALDLKLRKQLQVELRQLQRRVGITFVYVTHDQDEALTMSDRLAIMNAGRIEQTGAPEELYERPRTRFVAEFLGSCNLLDGFVQSRDGAFVSVQTAVGALKVHWDGQRRDAARGDRVALAIRPEKIVLDQAGANTNCLRARIEEAVYCGAETQYLLSSSGQKLKVCSLNARADGQQARVGDEVNVHFPPDALMALDQGDVDEKRK